MYRTLNLTKGGIFTALSTLLIYLSIIAPTNKIYLLGIASALIPLSIILTNIKNTILVYISSCILSLFLVGIKGPVLLYVLFFGVYGFAKYFIERIRKVPIELILKFLFFNVSLVFIFIFYKLLLPTLPKVKIYMPIALAMMQIIFFFYDYGLTLLIAYVNRRFSSRI